MTPQQIVGTACRLFSVWLAVLSFQAVAIGHALKDSGGGGSEFASYFFAAAYLVVAGLLWFFPMFIAHKLVPRTGFNEPLQLRGRMAVEVACIVLGLMVILWRALPGLSGYLSIAAFWVANGQPISTLESGRHVEAVAAMVQLAVGLVFVIKARVLAYRMVPEAEVDARGVRADV